MKDVLPEQVIRILGDRFAAGVANAEAHYNLHAADEDAVTGGLGQSLAICEPIEIVSNSKRYQISISYRKVRGRGPRAPEKLYGTDGLIQLLVKDIADNIAATKGLPFQSKMKWRGKDQKLYEQAGHMQERISGGIVIDFNPVKYMACTTKAAYTCEGDRKTADKYGCMRSLGRILAQDFLNCSIGRRGLYFDIDNESFDTDINWDFKSLHLISTTVSTNRNG